MRYILERLLIFSLFVCWISCDEDHEYCNFGRESYTLLSNNPNKVVALNYDGHHNAMLVHDSNNGLIIHYVKSNGDFPATSVTIQQSAYCDGGEIFAQDISGNGKDDIVCKDSSGKFSAMFNQNGAFRPEVDIAPDYSCSETVYFGNFDGVAGDDILCADASDESKAISMFLFGSCNREYYGNNHYAYNGYGSRFNYRTNNQHHPYSAHHNHNIQYPLPQHIPYPSQIHPMQHHPVPEHYGSSHGYNYPLPEHIPYPAPVQIMPPHPQPEFHHLPHVPVHGLTIPAVPVHHPNPMPEISHPSILHYPLPEHVPYPEPLQMMHPPPQPEFNHLPHAPFHGQPIPEFHPLSHHLPGPLSRIHQTRFKRHYNSRAYAYYGRDNSKTCGYGAMKSMSASVFDGACEFDSETRLLVMDYNNDGSDDIICVADDDTDSIFKFASNSRFINGNMFSSGVDDTDVFCDINNGARQIYATDIDGDGDKDIICLRPNANSLDNALYFNDGTGSFPNKHSIPDVGSPNCLNFCNWPASDNDVAIADFNGDGYEDLLCYQDDDSELDIIYSSIMLTIT